VSYRKRRYSCITWDIAPPWVGVVFTMVGVVEEEEAAQAVGSYSMVTIRSHGNQVCVVGSVMDAYD
jgi:hypothetical protein